MVLNASVWALISVFTILPFRMHAQADQIQKEGGAMKGVKVLFVLSGHPVKGSTGKPTGWYLTEAAHPWKVLHDEGIEVDFMSAKGGKPPVDGFNLEDPVNKEFWENPEVKKKLENTLTPDHVDINDYKAIHFVGGHGAMWDFPDNSEIARLAGAMYDNNGIVAAVCHGPAGLVNVKLKNGKWMVDGKTVAAYTNAEEEAGGMTNVVPFLLESKLKERGATHIAAPNKTENVQVDGRLITGQNPASARLVGIKILELLKSQLSR